MLAKAVNSEVIVIIGMTKSVSSDWRLRIRDFQDDDQGTSAAHVPFNACYG